MLLEFFNAILLIKHFLIDFAFFNSNKHFSFTILLFWMLFYEFFMHSNYYSAIFLLIKTLKTFQYIKNRLYCKLWSIFCANGQINNKYCYFYRIFVSLVKLLAVFICNLQIFFFNFPIIIFLKVARYFHNNYTHINNKQFFTPQNWINSVLYTQILFFKYFIILFFFANNQFNWNFSLFKKFTRYNLNFESSKIPKKFLRTNFSNPMKTRCNPLNPVVVAY